MGEAQKKPDIISIMARIREEVAAEIGTARDSLPQFVSHQVKDETPAGQLLYSEDLRFINQNYTYGSQFNESAITSHRFGIVGKIIVKIKRAIFRRLWDGLLRDYMLKEREFQASVVRYLNQVSKYVDARDASIFWGLNHKVDVDVTKATERADRLNDQFQGSLVSSERKLFDSINQAHKAVNNYEHRIDKLEAALRTMDNVVRGLEGIIAQSSKQVPKIDGSNTQSDLTYVLFENRFRGSQNEIEEHLNPYVEILKNVKGLVVDIGCGRGELLSLLKAQGISGKGIDLDLGMLSEAKAKGLDVIEGDGIKFLTAQPDKSIGAIVAIQVIEHLTVSQMDSLLALAKQKLIPGGKVIFETINPASVLAFVSNYARDPTHVFPQHPDTVSYRLSLAGFNNVETIFRSPIPEGGKIPSLQLESWMTPQWEDFVRNYNRGVEKLNALLFAPQDYAVIGQA